MKKTLMLVSLSTIIMMAFLGCMNSADNLQPPIAKVEPKIDSMFGNEMVDNYFWLRGKEKPEVIQYLKDENSYTEGKFAHTKDLQEKMYQELKGRIKETDLSVPVKNGDYYYYSRDEEGKQYEINCRKKGSLDAEEEILLDENVLAEGQEFMSVGTYEVSPDHTMLAYSIDTTGNERYLLQIKNLITGEIMSDRVEGFSGDLVWANDNKTVFYTMPDETWRPHQLYRHEIGTASSDDKLIHQEDDDKYWMGVGRTRSNAFILLYLGSKITSEIQYLDANNPTGKFKMFASRTKGIEYEIDHHGKDFYIVTNENAINFKLMKTPVNRTEKSNWKEVIPHKSDVMLNSIDLFKDHMVVYQRVNGLPTITIHNFKTDEKHTVKFAESVYRYRMGENPDFNQELLRFTYTSMVTPNSVYDYNMNSKERELKKQTEVLGGFDTNEYETKRIFATASDGKKIPIAIVYKKGMTQDGNNPVMLYGYGSYGYNYDAYFSSSRLSLLNRGFIVGIAQIRGGGEMGRLWYEDGKFLNKKNTFTDFIACAEHLISEKYTTKDKLAISGGSAGGLLIGAVLNLRPDLFHAAVADVPFVDVINTMLDESIPLTVVEYEEWGNPNEEKFFNYMMSYSPYDNVKEQEYPHLLIQGGLNDTRVMYWEPAKWAAKLRTMNKGENLLLLKTNMGAGHGGASGRYDYLKDIAFEYIFVLECMNMAS